MSEIAVSVILLTYNHAKFIEQAARSILTQNVDQLTGSIEIIVGEDCSRDETANILRKLDQEFSGRMTLLLRPKNLGLSKNLEDCWRRCEGRYIAILEGDDFWTDSNKLTKVVKLLDEHPEYSGCWHAYHVESTVASVPSGMMPDPYPVAPLGVEDLLDYNHLRSYSLICYRRGLVPTFPLGHRHLASGDWLLNLVHASHGPFGFVPDVMATYRLHPAGMVSNMDEGQKIFERMEVFFAFDSAVQGNYHEQIAAICDRDQKRLSRELFELRKISARYHALQLDKLSSLAQWLVGRFRRK